MNEAAQLSKILRQAAANASTHIVNASLNISDHSPTVQIGLSERDAAELIETARPKVLYLQEITLIVEDEIETALDDADVAEGEAAYHSVLVAARPLKAHVGEVCRALGGFVVDGVVHHMYAEADWMSDFEQIVEEIVASKATETLLEKSAEFVACDERVRELATALMSHSAFSIRPVSAKKRRYLAGELFPKETDVMLNRVVELAELMDWYTRSLE